MKLLGLAALDGNAAPFYDQRTAGSLANEQFSAWLGNRDGAPAFGSMVGVPDYYDGTVTSQVVVTCCSIRSRQELHDRLCIRIDAGGHTAYLLISNQGMAVFDGAKT